jgi:NAD(P)H-dependent FMN reductase
MPKLHTVICSTRPGRIGLPVAHWFHAIAEKHARFEVSLIDLAEVNLPMLDEPAHPRFKTYTKDHTKAWSASVSAADAFVFVTPEYDYGAPATLLNALHFLFQEWNYKPCAFVSYGGVSGGTRSVQMAKSVVTAVKMMPMAEAVSIPFVGQYLAEDKKTFTPPDGQAKAAVTMLDELLRWTEALKTLRS